jgi:hypothetical protein
MAMSGVTKSDVALSNVAAHFGHVRNDMIFGPVKFDIILAQRKF